MKNFKFIEEIGLDVSIDGEHLINPGLEKPNYWVNAYDLEEKLKDIHRTSIYTTKKEDYPKILKIAKKMYKSGEPIQLVNNIIMFASKYEGAYDLMELWYNESDSKERRNIINSLKEELCYM